MENAVSIRNRTLPVNDRDRDSQFRSTLIETLRWFCSEVPEMKLQSSLESLFSQSQKCSMLNCSVIKDSAEYALNYDEPESSSMHGPSAVEIPYFSEFTETPCSLSFRLDNIEQFVIIIRKLVFSGRTDQTCRSDYCPERILQRVR